MINVYVVLLMFMFKVECLMFIYVVFVDVHA